MSNASVPSDSTLDESTKDRWTQTLRGLSASIAAAGRAGAFWAAVGMPFLYVPLLAFGLETQQDVLVFLGLLVVNVVALVVGRGHRRE